MDSIINKQPESNLKTIIGPDVVLCYYQGN